ncbi:MAG: ABC transporter ATP-binding protein [Gammaproteobacteria bacterium]|jgi:lipopolysaccharide transport system ATP-binding protein|nr:ABC transporter ATP-binding protein [Bacteroidetes Order II. bacterium]MBT6585656.1 ABC transporter ATP-binding protein [Gammaproteobacteria bacterium]MBT7878885.1 ABC transporter ATP-binding protein [Gammaproteobacteria bacterium]
MTNIVIKSEDLGKRYLIGHDSTKGRYQSLQETLLNQLRRFSRSARDIIQGRLHVDGDVVEEFWALRNVSFEVEAGSAVGIIGRNGAGKSTLLKVLSRITDPTEGRVEIRGRVASLLEVGTGFHPELSGRENIFLNGTILGMSQNEIKSRFDEIVDFAEIEQFLDTPVKRYSSGMYVRLAFAVAAHLEPEILVVDEVLAVGDADFQRKCLGKMNAVAETGRTVLFVSHNMAAISSLTRSVLMLDRGEVIFSGPTEQAISKYGSMTQASNVLNEAGQKKKGDHTNIRAARLLSEDGTPLATYLPGNRFKIELEVETDGTRGLSCDLFLVDEKKMRTALGSMSHFEGSTLPLEPGVYTVLMTFEPINLASGQYTIDITTSLVNHSWDHYIENALSFEVLYSNAAGLAWDHRQEYGYGNFSLTFALPTLITHVAHTEY